MKTKNKLINLKSVVSLIIQEAMDNRARIFSPEEMRDLRKQLGLAEPASAPAPSKPKNLEKEQKPEEKFSKPFVSKQNARLFTPEEADILRKAAVILRDK
jgi:hypothetical protein